MDDFDGQYQKEDRLSYERGKDMKMICNHKWIFWLQFYLSLLASSLGFWLNILEVLSHPRACGATGKMADTVHTKLKFVWRIRTAEV